jgi:hypothetical protein
LRAAQRPSGFDLGDQFGWRAKYDDAVALLDPTKSTPNGPLRMPAGR